MQSRARSSGPQSRLLCLMAGLLLTAMTGMGQNFRAGQLATGKVLTLSPLGTQLNVGSLPMNVILSPNGQYALVSDICFDQSLTSINASTGAFASNIDYPNCNYCYSQNTNGPGRTGMCGRRERHARSWGLRSLHLSLISWKQLARRTKIVVNKRAANLIAL